MNEQNTPVTVEKFCILSETEWDALASEHALSSLRPYFARVAHHYRFGERRDPFLHELRFLDGLAAILQNAPQTVRVCALSGEAEQLRVFRDLCRMREALGKENYPTLEDLVQTSGEYLARAGITPHREDLVALPNAHAALHPAFVRDVLSTSHASATLSTIERARIPNVGVLLAYTPAQGTDTATAFASFLSEHRALGVTPIAPIGAKGALPHLLHTGGVMLDVKTSELTACLFPHSLLFTAPEGALATLFSKGLPIALLGKLTPTGMLRVLCGGALRFSAPLTLLRTLCADRVLSIACAADCGTFDAPVINDTNGTLLGGTVAEGNVEGAILSLVSALAKRGGDFRHATASVLLECPTHATTDVLSHVMPLLLALHRATAELSLPILRASLFSCDVAKPRLCVFLAVKKGEPREIASITDWQSARDILYGT